MHLVDTTLFFCPRSGGVKRYLLAKQASLHMRRRAIRHSLLVPAPQDALTDVKTCKASSIPLIDGYRFPLSVSRWREALVQLRPDLIEVADPYVPLLAARDAGQRLGVPVAAFFHSDLPRMLSQRIGSWVAPVARKYLRAIYRDVDRVLSPSQVMLNTLHEARIGNTTLQPLGVDTEVFHPARRDCQLPARPQRCRAYPMAMFITCPASVSARAVRGVDRHRLHTTRSCNCFAGMLGNKVINAASSTPMPAGA